MNLKQVIEFNNRLDEYLLSQGIQPFDWDTYLKEEREANQERLDNMTLEEQEAEIEKEAKQFLEEYEEYDDFED